MTLSCQYAVFSCEVIVNTRIHPVLLHGDFKGKFRKSMVDTMLFEFSRNQQNRSVVLPINYKMGDILCGW